MTKNTISRYCWAYETTAYRTPAITAVVSTSYLFGEYDESILKWAPPAVEAKVGNFWTYNSRTPTFTDLKLSFPTFSHAWNPTTPQHAVWMLGKCTDAAPDTFEPYAVSTSKMPMTIRFEEDGGTTPRLTQAAGCYMVELYCRARIGAPYMVEGQFAYSDIYDVGDYDILTTMPTACGGAGVSQLYNGAPIVVYDVGGGGEATLTDVVMAEWRIKQNYSTVMDSDDLGQTVYPDTFEPVELILTALMESGTKWDDFIDRNAKDYSVQVYKPRGTYNIKYIFDNVRILKCVEEAEVKKGMISSKLIATAEKVTGTFAWDGSGTWADHFKTAT